MRGIPCRAIALVLSLSFLAPQRAWSAAESIPTATPSRVITIQALAERPTLARFIPRSLLQPPHVYAKSFGVIHFSNSSGKIKRKWKITLVTAGVAVGFIFIPYSVVPLVLGSVLAYKGIGRRARAHRMKDIPQSVPARPHDPQEVLRLEKEHALVKDIVDRIVERIGLGTASEDPMALFKAHVVERFVGHKIALGEAMVEIALTDPKRFRQYVHGFLAGRLTIVQKLTPEIALPALLNYLESRRRDEDRSALLQALMQDPALREEKPETNVESRAESIIEFLQGQLRHQVPPALAYVQSLYPFKHRPLPRSVAAAA